MGRPIPDYSNTAVGVPPNDASLRPDLCNLWGKISHPTAVDLCAAMEAAKAADPNEKIFISRVDIKSAYPRVLIDAKHTALLSTLVTTRHPIFGVVVSVPIVNQWGAQGAGYSFEALGRNLLSRSLLRFNHVDQIPRALMFVDDHIAVGTHDRVTAEVAAFESDATALIGPDAIAREKNLMGQIIDAIGYRADTVNWRIGPSAKAVRKLFHVFFVEFPDTLTAGDRVSVRQLQRVSAYAIRYSATIVPMRPFSMAFSNNFRGASMHKNAKRRLTGATIADLNMWRTILAAVFEKPMWLSVPTAWPIETARCLTEGSSRADIIVYADAQVTDGGLGIYIPNISWAYAQMCQMTMDDNGRSVPLSNNAAKCTATRFQSEVSPSQVKYSLPSVKFKGILPRF